MIYHFHTRKKDEAYHMLKSSDAFLVLWEFLELKLRQYIKYGHSFKTPDEALEQCREDLFELLEERGISLTEE